MTLATGEFIRRFLMHVLPKGLHRIRHYALFANGSRAGNLARIRALLEATKRPSAATPTRENDPFLGVRFGVLLSNQSRHEHHQRSDPHRKTPNLHSLD